MSNYVGRMRAILGLDKRGFDKGLNETQTKMQRVAQRMHQIGKNVARAGAGLSVVSAGVTLAIRQQLNAADQMSKDAQKLGVPIDQLSALRHAADMSGVSTGELDTALGRMARTMDEAAQGGKRSAELFERLGVKVTGADGKLRPMSAVIADVAGVLSEMPDGAEKSALAIELFGRSGAALIPMLNSGKDGLQGMLDEARELGLVIDEKTGKAAENFNDNLSRLAKTIKGIVIQSMAAMAPMMEKISNAAVEASKIFRNMSPASQRLAAGIAAVTAVAGPLALGLGAVLMAVKPLLAGLALLASPIGLIVAGLVAVGVGAAYVVRNWDALVARFPSLGRAVEVAKVPLSGFRDFLHGPFADVLRATHKLVTGDFSGAFKSARQALGNLIDLVRRFTLSTLPGLQEVGLQVSRVFPESFRNSISEALEALRSGWENIKQFVSEWPAQFVEYGRNLVDGLRDGINQRIDAVRESLVGKWNGIKNDVKNAFGIQSPSKVFAQIGRDLMAGLGVGIENGADGPVAGLMQVADRLTQQGAGMQDIFQRIGSTSRGVFSQIGQSVGNVIRGTMKWREALQNVLKSLAQVFAQRAQAQAVSAFGGAGSIGGALVGGLIGGLTGFEGGGYTGDGARVGGLDGKGAFLAKLHPQESVIDHTKGQSMGGGVAEVRVIGGDLTLTDDGTIAARVQVVSAQTTQQALRAYDREALPRKLNQRRRG